MPCFTEKEGIYVNLEGRAQISRQVKLPIENVDYSYDFFNKLSKTIGLTKDYSSLEDLRNLMYHSHPNLMKINQLKSEKNIDVKSFTKKFSNEDIKSNIKNFYMTDSVSRNSPTMSTCSLEINNKSLHKKKNHVSALVLRYLES